MPYRNEFVINGASKTATNKQNTLKIGNQMASKFRKGIMNQSIRNYDPSENELFPQNTASAIPLPDNSLTTRYFKDGSIDSDNLAKNIVFPRNTSAVISDESANSVATLRYLNSSIDWAFEELQLQQSINEILNTFSDDVSGLQQFFPSIDTSLSIIENSAWINESNIDDQSITGDKYDDSLILPSGVQVATSTDTEGLYLATTSYLRTQYANFKADASVSSVGNIARSIIDMTDASFRALSERKTDRVIFDASHSVLLEKKSQIDNSLNILNQSISLDLVENYRQTKNIIDASISVFYTNDSSFSDFLEGQTLYPAINNTTSVLNSRENTISQLKTNIDASINVISSHGWVESGRLDSDLTLSNDATIAAPPTDASSLQIVSTNYVKTELNKITTSSSIQSYQDFLVAVAGDASFAYSVVQNLNQLDASCIEPRDKIDSLEIYGNNALQQNYENLERKLREQYDVSVNSFSIASFVENTDACLNSLYADQNQRENAFGTLSVNTSSGLNSMYIQTKNLETAIRNITANYDTSYSLLKGKMQSQYESLSIVDNSLNSFLVNRENMFESEYQTTHSLLKHRFVDIDASLSSFSQNVDSSLNNVGSSFNTSDNSLNLLPPLLYDISSNQIPSVATIIDSSLAILREIFVDTGISLDLAEVPLDQSVNFVETIIGNTESSISAIDSSLSLYIKNRHESLSQHYATNVSNSTTSMDTIHSMMVSRENTWKQYHETTDTSFSNLVIEYDMLYGDVVGRQTALAVLDTSMTYIYRQQSTAIDSADTSFNTISVNTIERMDTLYGLLSIADQSVNRLDYTVADSSVNTSLEKMPIHDSSLSIVKIDGWVESQRLANAIALPSSVEIAVAGEPSGNQVATSGFFKNYLRDIVGATIPPFESLNVLANALNNSDEYALFINSYLDDISSNLSSIRTAIQDISMNTGSDFNYDASLNFLNGKIDGLDTSFNISDVQINTYVSITDGSVGYIENTIQTVDNAVKSLEERNIEGIAGRQINQQQMIESMIEWFDSSLSTIDQEVVAEKNTLDFIVPDVLFIRDVVVDLCGSFVSRFQETDASNEIIQEKYRNVEYRGSGVEVDASLSSISNKISTVDSGVRTYLRNSVGGASYQSTFIMLADKLSTQDSSLSIFKNRVDLSYSQIILQGNAIEDSIVNVIPSYNYTDASCVAVAQVSNTVNNNISTVNSNGWVVDGRLDNSIVLPTGVGVSSGNPNIASVSSVKTLIHDVILNADNTLNTLNELALAFGEDVNLAVTIQSRLDSTDSSLSLLTQGLDGDIAVLTGDYAGRVDSINSMVYPSLETNMDTIYLRMYSNDVSTNLAGSTLNSVNSGVESAIRRLETNDASTNYVDGRFLVAENAIPVIDTSLNGVVPLAEQLDVSFVLIENLDATINGGLGTNDASTNLLGSSTGIVVREASANNVIALLGRPDNFRVTGTTATSITCGYVEPVLKDAIGVSSYRLTATPTYGTTTVVTNTAAVGTNAISATPLVSGAVYDLSLAATNQYGVVVVSGLSSPTVLAPPTGLIGSASTTSSFTASWTSEGGVFTRYAFRLENGGVNVSSGDLSNNVVSRNFTGLTDGTSYLVAVRSANPFVQSVDVSMIYGTIFSAPSTPSFVSRTSTDLFFSVTGTMKPYLRYNISYRRLDGTDASATDVSSNFRLSGLTDGRIYDVSVNIQNAFGVSAWSPVVRNSTALSVPAISVSTITDSAATITYSTLPQQDCTYVLRTNPNVNQYVLSAGSTSQTLTGLTSLSNYTVFLDASNLYMKQTATSTFKTLGTLNQNIYVITTTNGVNETRTTIDTSEYIRPHISQVFPIVLANPSMQIILISRGVSDSDPLVRSTNGGKTFTTVLNENLRLYGNMVGSESLQYVYILQSNAFYMSRSTDYGATFTTVNTLPVYPYDTRGGSIACNRTGDKVIFWNDNTSSLYMSIDYGASFSLLKTFSSFVNPVLKISPNSQYILLSLGKRIIVGYDPNGISTASTGTVTWTDKTFSGATATNFFYTQILDNGMIFLTEMTGVNRLDYITYANFLSATSNTNWTTVPNTVGYPQFRVSQDANTIIYIRRDNSYSFNTIYTTRNRGTTWSTTNINPALYTLWYLTGFYVDIDFTQAIYGSKSGYYVYSKAY